MPANCVWKYGAGFMPPSAAQRAQLFKQRSTPPAIRIPLSACLGDSRHNAASMRWRRIARTLLMPAARLCDCGPAIALHRNGNGRIAVFCRQACSVLSCFMGLKQMQR